LLVVTIGLAFGQASFDAQVRGVVRDSSGSVIVGARVTITDVATNISNATTTDESGTYIFKQIASGNLSPQGRGVRLRAEEAKNDKLDVSQHTSLDFALQVTGLESSVTVVEAATMLETATPL
jgi:hypothetical protein